MEYHAKHTAESAAQQIRDRMEEAARVAASARANGNYNAEQLHRAQVQAYAHSLAIIGAGGTAEEQQRAAYIAANHQALFVSAGIEHDDMARAKRARLAAEAALELVDLTREVQA